MFSVRKLSWCVVFLLWVNLPLAFGEVRFIVEKEIPIFDGIPIVYVEVNASTWKPRGRLLYDVEGAVRVKLMTAGFDLVRTESSPHDFTVSVDYQETRGVQLGVNDFGTVMTGIFRLQDDKNDSLFELNIQETADSLNVGTPPYLDALRNFQTNPYYYFLGDIVWAQVHGNHQAQTIFLEALERMARHHQRTSDVGEDASEFSHSMRSPQAVFASTAIQRTLHEFLPTTHQQMIPLLLLLLDYPHANVRVSAIKTLGTFRARHTIPFLEALKRKDVDIGVRKAAQAVIQDFEASE